MCRIIQAKQLPSANQKELSIFIADYHALE